MSSALAGSGRRFQAYAYTLVTSAIVMVFALAEWVTERFVSDHSRVASTAIEILIVLVAALLFRPVHKRVETAVENAFTKRKREALAALTKFRRELGSFNDVNQLLRRVIEAIEQHLEARACAVYLRRETFRAEASSFDAAAGDLDLDDPLVIRLRSSGAPAQPPHLKSAAFGTHAFPITAAGDLVGILLVHARHGDYDDEELQMLTGLAQDLASALIALDMKLRPKTARVPNNIPADLPALVGRDRELAEIEAALSQSRLVTITVPAGVGKSCIALKCAADAIPSRENGAWFINLAPIEDGTLVAATMLSTLGADVEGDSDVERVVDYLRERDMVLVIDNCEHVISDVAAIVARIRESCSSVTVLATSRELLHLNGEQVYRLGSLRPEAAAELFAERAAAVSSAFDMQRSAQVVRAICDHLDGIPLAIELAAARVRALSVDDIFGRLHERFRLLTSSARTASPRQQTLAATIEWSYDLLVAEEQSLFRRLSVFRGSFTLAAAAAVCGGDVCDEFHVLDVLTSLVDKSLLTFTLALTTRYRLLETISTFASQRAVEQQAAEIAQRQHAAYFAGVAAHAYHEFDTQLPEGWLERLAPDVDNFRAALAWTLEGAGDRRTGAQFAADCGPMFLRMQLLSEGLRWCALARDVPGLSPATAGRIDYVASMLHNNAGDHASALACAERSVSFYERSDDERGLIRALSQIAQQYARAKRFDDAQVPSAEAIRRARSLGEPRVLIAVLRRCAYSLPPERIEEARVYFSEALEAARAVHEPEEAYMVLEWWAAREASAGDLERALELATQGIQYGAHDRLVLEGQITGWALALNRLDEAFPHARQTLELAIDSPDPLSRLLSIAYWSPFQAAKDIEEAALLFGYASARINQLVPELDADDRLALENAERAITEKISSDRFEELKRQGAALTEDSTLSILRAALALDGEREDAAIGARHRVITLLI